MKHFAVDPAEYGDKVIAERERLERSLIVALADMIAFDGLENTVELICSQLDADQVEAVTRQLNGE